MADKNWSPLDEDADTAAATEAAPADDDKAQGGQAGPTGNGGTMPEQKTEEDQNNKTDKTELLLCAGGTCVCDKAKSPNPVKLNVISHQKYFINDPDGSKKYIATIRENNIAALNFSECKVPDPSKPVPCTAQLKWEKYYESVELPGKSFVLTEKSEATCAKGGKITVKTTGQEQAVTAKHLEEANASAWSATNPAVSEQDAEIKQADNDTDNSVSIGVTKIKTKTESPTEGTYPPGSTVDFEATAFTKKNPTDAEKKTIDWIVYNGTTGQPITTSNDVGAQMSTVFNKPGEYIVEAYGKNPGATDAKKKGSSAFQRVSIKDNEMTGVAESNGQTKIRIGQPATFNVSTLFPVDQTPFPAASGQVTWELQVKDGAQPVLSNTEGMTTTATASDKSSYVVIARQNGKTFQSPLIQVLKNRVKQITIDKTSVRLGEAVHVDASKGFEFSPPTPDEIAQLKWKCVDDKGGEHPNAVVNGAVSFDAKLSAEGKYKIYAYLMAPSEEVTASFEVVKPRLAQCCWRGDDGEVKTSTGWDEESTIWLSFKSAQGMTVDIEIYAVNSGGGKTKIFTYTGAKISSENTFEQKFTLDKKKFGEKLKAGDKLAFVVRNKTQGQTIDLADTYQPQDKLHLQLKTDEKITSIGFYKGGKRIYSANYGDTMKCRVYARNLSTKELTIKIYRHENWRIDTQMGDTLKVTVGKEGYGEADFTLPKDMENKYGGNIHQFYGWVKEDEMFGSSLEYGMELKNNEFSVQNIQTKALLVVTKNAKAPDASNSPVGVDKMNDRKPSGKCFCNRDFTVQEVKDTVNYLTGQQKIWYGKNCAVSDKSYEALTRELNAMMTRYNITSCIRKIHFLAQVCEETGVFGLSEEGLSKYKSSQSTYKGRGILQLTGAADATGFYNLPGAYQSYADYVKQPDVVTDPGKVATDIHLCIDSGGWEWAVAKVCPKWEDHKNDSESTKKQKKYLREKYADLLGKTPNQIADYEDTYLMEISKLINGFHDKAFPINWSKRQTYYNLLKNKVFRYKELCNGGTAKNSKVDGLCPKCGTMHYDDLVDTVVWQTQFNPKWGDKAKQNVACWKTCHDILITAGLGDGSGSQDGKFQTALENAKHTQLDINTDEAKKGVAYIDSELKAGRPILVGVDHALNYKGGTLNEGTTDHFIVIVGKGCDDGKICYRFYDVGTSHMDKGASEDNKLYLNATDYSLKGTTAYNGSTYTVTQVRKNV